ncbi:sodium/hydrogen exchanger [Thermodesulfatator indicus DSM 15286]|uniref:Sodium/hydrogen exchanger n=1 Tax=Thermodesulfatator indicus (strain DSM 15286 / JCM 11887 / CIR29812) TaxID=667014 RepID=F8AAI1_THEID|nr:sodium:proton antiporter [Thermodesulfatator indicus]AEH45401.1 sodium/hydrogen exchanger [Thermodesulfatator indicus DSM 15286]
MSLYTLVTLLLCLAVLSGYLNYRLLKLPSGIGATLVAIFIGFLALAAESLWPECPLTIHLKKVVQDIEFEEAVLHWMLGFLLFAGALHVELDTLLKRLRSILSLATLGVFLSTTIIGFSLYFLAKIFGLHLPILWALLFGALISPTDPVAVLATLRKAGVSKETEIVIVGESLLNDGVAVVIFLALLEMLKTQAGIDVFHILVFLVQECFGGLVLGALLGFLAFLLLKDVDDYELEVLITVALVMLCFSLAEKFHLSGPLAVVAAGLLIGNHGRRLAMSPKTIEHIDTFWRLVDSLLNAVLFLLIGLEILVINQFNLFLALASIFLVLCGRFLSVSVSMAIAKPLKSLSFQKILFFTWCGLKGGIAVALAFSLPEHPLKSTLLSLTYFNVVFSVIGQGLTLKTLAQRLKF